MNFDGDIKITPFNLKEEQGRCDSEFLKAKLFYNKDFILIHIFSITVFVRLFTNCNCDLNILNGY